MDAQTFQGTKALLLETVNSMKTSANYPHFSAEACRAQGPAEHHTCCQENEWMIFSWLRKHLEVESREKSSQEAMMPGLLAGPGHAGSLAGPGAQLCPLLPGLAALRACFCLPALFTARVTQNPRQLPSPSLGAAQGTWCNLQLQGPETIA